ncbi:YlbE-like family protein [Anoxybacillus sp. J5B_2022]|uniref:YlbE-like family protein n=1 Tax=Anoxybacillus sp. J5B_2022 TaxID=3003246 RepID=UPI0022862059|nr:YlbE-like family protein [Anoxybacillus sp. J5B_2022]MCZ0754216.1 YlbE-like family protein [Anoxybacillus sp. J5B_2022]
MRKEVIHYIRSKKMLQKFIREQPRWYRTLAREPHKLHEFERAALHYYEQTIPHKVEKIANSLEMASLMLHMFRTMRD